MNTNNTLRVDEIFTSIQGEGLHSGRLMKFIRLAGCNLKCRYCDTSENKVREELTVNEAAFKTGKPRGLPIYITGGEPMLQEATLLLIIKILSEGREVHLDTNGSIDLTAVAPITHKIVDIKTPGSGAGGSFLESNLEAISYTDEIKFVVTSREDFDWAVEYISKSWLINLTPNVFIQPAWGMVEYSQVIDWMKESVETVRLSAQLHKFIWGPDIRGV